MTSSVIPMTVPRTQCQMEEVRVQGVEGNRILLQTPMGVEMGQRAVSCLVNPESGDLVLVSRSYREIYVLSVLEREGSEQSEITLGFNGPLKVSSPEQITIRSHSAHWVNCVTSVSTGKLSVAATSMDALSEEVTLHSSAIKMISRSLDVISDRISRNARTLISMVRGNEVRQSNQLTEQVINTHMQQSKQTVVDARKDLRMNAERIHMG